MKKIIYKKTQDCGYWSAAGFISDKNSLLDLLITSFNEYRDWITIDVVDDKVFIWNDFDEKYFSQENIPKLVLSKENYNKIIEQWNNNLENPASYLMLSQNDIGLINLECKQELSQDDLDYIESEKQAKTSV